MMIRAVWASVLPRPAVSRDWVKARCFEFTEPADTGVHWNEVGPAAWYFDAEHFGIRRFDRGDGAYVLIIAPDGDGPHSYVYWSDGRLQESTDDAASVNCVWASVKTESTAESILGYAAAYRDIGAYSLPGTAAATARPN